MGNCVPQTPALEIYYSIKLLFSMTPESALIVTVILITTQQNSRINPTTLLVSLLLSTAHPPEVNVAPVEVKVRKGQNAEFVCSATGLNASSFIYQWFFNDLPVASQTMPTLVINDVTENDTGEYVCFVRNPYGAIGQSAVARLILFGKKSNIAMA